MQIREFPDFAAATTAEGVLCLAGYSVIRDGAAIITDASERTLDQVEVITGKKKKIQTGSNPSPRGA